MLNEAHSCLFIHIIIHFILNNILHLLNIERYIRNFDLLKEQKVLWSLAHTNDQSTFRQRYLAPFTLNVILF